MRSAIYLFMAMVAMVLLSGCASNGGADVSKKNLEGKLFEASGNKMTFGGTHINMNVTEGSDDVIKAITGMQVVGKLGK